MMKRLIPVLMVAGADRAGARSVAVAADIDARIRAGRERALADHAHAPFPRRRLRAAPDRHAEPQSGGRVGDQDDGVVGLYERPPRAVGLRPSRLGERALFSAHHLARERSADVRSRRVDAGYERHRHGRRVPDDSARAADAPRQLTAFLATQKDKVAGKIVLVGKAAMVPVNLNPPAKRRDDEQLRRQYDPGQSRTLATSGRGGPQGPPPPMTAAQLNLQIDEFLVANGAKVRVDDAAREHGQIIEHHNRTYDVTKAVPTVVMRNEDYGRIARILADGTPVELEFNIVEHVVPGREDRLQHDRRDPGHRQEGRNRDARRPSRFVERRPPAPPTTRSAARR